jgi:sulfofructose kinase
LQIVGVGLPTWDYIIETPFVPGPDSSLDVHLAARTGGGRVAVALVAVSRLGHDASLIGQVADDDIGRAITDELRAEGVSLDFLEVGAGRDGPQSFIFILPRGERTILYHEGDLGQLRLSSQAAQLIGKADALVLEQGYCTLPPARIAADASVPIICDIEHLDDDVFALAQLNAILIAGESVLDDPSGHTAADVTGMLVREGARAAIVTLGERGAVGRDDSGIHQVAAYGEEIVDTTGAGDVYHGAFTVGLLEGMKFQAAMKFAAIMAGLKCRAHGREGIPRRDEMELRMHAEDLQVTERQNNE